MALENKEDSAQDNQQKYDDELVQHLNCQTKQSATEGPDL